MTQTEQSRPGQTKPAESGVSRGIRDVGQVRAFTRTTLKYFGEDPKSSVVKAVVEFVDAAFYAERNVPNPEKLYDVATRRAERFGLSQEEVTRSRQLAADMLVACKYAVSGRDGSVELTPQARDILERRKAFLRQREQAKRQNKEQAKEKAPAEHEYSPYATLRGKGTDPNKYLRDGSGKEEYDLYEPEDPDNF